MKKYGSQKECYVYISWVRICYTKFCQSRASVSDPLIKDRIMSFVEVDEEGEQSNTARNWPTNTIPPICSGKGQSDIPGRSRKPVGSSFGGLLNKQFPQPDALLVQTNFLK